MHYATTLDLLNVNGLACDEGADAEEEETDGSEGWSESLPEDVGSIAASGSSADDLTTGDQASFAAGMLPRATDRQSRVFETVSEEDLSPRRSRKGRFNRNTDLSVRLDEKLSTALGMRTFMMKCVVEAQDNDEWKVVTATEIWPVDDPNDRGS